MAENRVSDFFIPDNKVILTDELDYSIIDHYIKAAAAFSRSSYQSIYIIDYFRRKFLYVSPNSLLLCGMTPEEMMKINYQFYLEYVPKDEQKLLLEFNRIGFAFFHSIPLEERKEMYIQYDFHILTKYRPILINHKLTPLVLTSDGRIWLALCVVSASNHSTPGHVRVHRIGSPNFFVYNRITHRWDQRCMPTLTEGEKSVITFSIQGFTMSKIADIMCLSPDTIKKYRKQIFEKLNVRNISEAIISATNNKLI